MLPLALENSSPWPEPKEPTPAVPSATPVAQVRSPSTVRAVASAVAPVRERDTMSMAFWTSPATMPTCPPSWSQPPRLPVKPSTRPSCIAFQMASWEKASQL